MVVLIVVLVLLAALIALVLVRTAKFKPAAQETAVFGDVNFDRDAAEDALAELVKCRTVSDLDPANEDDAEFEKLIGKLPELYPNVVKTCPMQRFDARGLLFHWKGRGDGDPAVLMAHYDVVPVEEENWEKPPFDAVVENGVMWGRGTLDTKVTLNGIMSAAENLIKQGFTPENDIYFAFSGCEETNGPGASNIVEYFQSRGIVPSMVVDEGGGVVEDVFPGVKKPCALIGIAEKGAINLEFGISSNGGHASAPKPHTPVGRLALACTKLEAKPFKAHFEGPAGQMFDTLGRHSTFLYRMIFANLWLFKGILNNMCKKNGGEMNALVRTTVAFTQMRGSKAPNVIPPMATMVANLRLNPADSIASAMDYVRKTIKDDEITLTKGTCMEPSPISRTDCEGWQRVVNAVSGTWRGSIVSPYLMVQCSDSRHYRDLSDKVYRFSAMDLSAEERATIHGNNERIRLEVIHRAVEFFIRLMQQC